eukprot:scaffold306509_cov15-Tisochrysis_lutea.AAC.1
MLCVASCREMLWRCSSKSDAYVVAAAAACHDFSFATRHLSRAVSSSSAGPHRMSCFRSKGSRATCIEHSTAGFHYKASRQQHSMMSPLQRTTWVKHRAPGSAKQVSSCLRGDAAAHDYVKAVFNNVVVQPRDAREASDVFYKQKVGSHA